MGGALILRAKEVDNTLVHLDTRVDASALQDFGKGPSVTGFLVQGLVEKDDTRDVLIDRLISSEQQLLKNQENFKSQSYSHPRIKILHHTSR